MRAFLQNCLSRRFWWVVSVVCAGVLLSCSSAADAQVTQIYSFEPDLQGFGPNGAQITISLETSGLGATDGPNSMKVELTAASSFDGAITPNLHTIFTDPEQVALGLDFIRFDLTNTNRFAPPATDPPTPGVPTFAATSVTFFGAYAATPEQEAQIQYQFSEDTTIGSLEPGTRTIEIDLRNDGGEFLIGGGIDTGDFGTGDIGGYNHFRDAGFIPASFQIYFNKSVMPLDPAFAWTVYVDNIRAGRDVVGVPGDFNVDGSVDAADYVVWRKNDGTNNALPNDDGLGTPITGAHYDLWRANFGGPLLGVGAASAVPEPSSILLLIVGAMCCGRRTCGRGGV